MSARKSRVMPNGSSYGELNPNPFSKQLKGYVAYKKNIDGEKSALELEMEALKQKMEALQMEQKKLESVDHDSDDEYDRCDDDDEHGMTDDPFESKFQPDEMRCLALVAHNHMKPAIKQFVLDNRNILKKFMLTGTNTTMSMLREVFGDDPTVKYGPTCQSGPLGGDAELCALMCQDELGGLIFLQDPMDSHPHQADIECLVRQALVHDVLMAGNTTSAYALMTVLRLALKTGKKQYMSSFFKTEYSPSVAEYKRRQQAVLDAAIAKIEKDGKDETTEGARESLIDTTVRFTVADIEEVVPVEADTRMSTMFSNRSSMAVLKDSQLQSICEVDARETFAEQVAAMDAHKELTKRHRASQAKPLSDEEQLNALYGLEEEIDTTVNDPEFWTPFGPHEMRCLALVAHNHMKPAMREFVENNKNVLRKFRLTGTNTTMSMLREVFGDDESILYGPTCQSGPLGGDAQIVALMCVQDLGGMIFLQDPMDAHPHQADIECLNRQANVHDVYVANNPESAYAMTKVLRRALKKGNKSRISSFFETKKSPSVAEYKKRQNAVLQAAILDAGMKEEDQVEALADLKEEEDVSDIEDYIKEMKEKRKKKKGLKKMYKSMKKGLGISKKKIDYEKSVRFSN